jgi:hypothetical protein
MRRPPVQAIKALVTKFNPNRLHNHPNDGALWQAGNGRPDGFCDKALHANRRQITVLWKQNIEAPNGDS